MLRPSIVAKRALVSLIIQDQRRRFEFLKFVFQMSRLR